MLSIRFVAFRAAIVGWIAATLFAAGTVLAQDEQPTFATIKGEVKGVAPGGIVVEDATGNVWNIKAPMDPKEFSILGQADQSFLRPGLLIRVEALVNKKFEIEKPISSLTVITERDQYDVGLIPTTETGGGGSGAFFSAPEEKEKKKKKAPKPKIENEVEFKIGAYITGIKGNKLTLNAGGTMLKAELDENLKISVDAASLEFARVGDKADVDAIYYESRVMAGAPCESRKMTIKAAAPFSADSGKKKGKTAAKKTQPKAKPKAKTEEAKEEMEEKEDADEKSDDKPEAKSKEKANGKKQEAKKEDADEDKSEDKDDDKDES